MKQCTYLCMRTNTDHLKMFRCYRNHCSFNVTFGCNTEPETVFHMSLFKLGNEFIHITNQIQLELLGLHNFNFEKLVCSLTMIFRDQMSE